MPGGDLMSWRFELVDGPYGGVTEGPARCACSIGLRDVQGNRERTRLSSLALRRPVLVALIFVASSVRQTRNKVK